MIRFSRSVFSLVVLALLGTVVVGGCKKAKLNPFPSSGEIAGWQKTGDTRVFAAQDLWQYIDGDAEQYLKAGVVTTSTSDYKFQNRIEAAVDVHTMRDAAGAQTIFERGRGSQAKTVSLGDSGIAYEQSVLFHKGPYLVRIVAYEASPETEQALLNLAHGVEARL